MTDVEFDATGDFQVVLLPDATIPDGDRTIDCRTDPGRCVLRAGTYDAEFDEIATSDLEFDPTAPLRPPVALHVEPSTGLVDGQAVTVTASGFRIETATNTRTGSSFELYAAPNGRQLRCRSFKSVVPDASGIAAPVSIGASASFDPGDGGPPVDCTVKAGACVVLSKEGGTGDVSTAPVTFAPPRPPARYLDSVFGAADVTHDLVYGHAINSTGVDQQLHLDLYQPAADTNRHRPLMIWMHGGYFRDGDKRDMASLATGMAKRGYVSASLEYRLRPTGATSLDPIRDALADAETAVAWLRQHASDYGIDPDRIAIGGYSAGAFTAINLGYAADRPNGQPANVKAVVSIAGGLSIGRPEAGEPPALFFHSRDDTVVGYGVGQSSCAQIQAAGPGCALITYEGIGHSWIESDTLLRTSAFLTNALKIKT